MTIQELIDLLSKYESDRLVVIAADAEGNGHSPLDRVEACFYIADNKWSGYTVDELEEGDDGIKAVVLEPIN